jgi:hypothetical protein
LNDGFARTTNGDYFAYLGSDDLWLPDFLAARVELLQTRPNAVLAYGNAFSIDESNRITDCTTDWAKYVDGDVRQMLFKMIAPLSPTVVYRRSALPARPWNESARLEDHEVYLRLSAAGEFAFDPRVLSAWRQHDSNTSHDPLMMLDEWLAAQERTAKDLGLSASELEQYQSLTRFRSAQQLIRRGQKRAALRLLLRNRGGAPSAAEAVRVFGALIAPHALMKRRKASLRERAYQRYGQLSL